MFAECFKVKTGFSVMLLDTVTVIWVHSVPSRVKMSMTSWFMVTPYVISQSNLGSEKMPTLRTGVKLLSRWWWINCKPFPCVAAASKYHN